MLNMKNKLMPDICEPEPYIVYKHTDNGYYYFTKGKCVLSRKTVTVVVKPVHGQNRMVRKRTVMGDSLMVVASYDLEYEPTMEDVAGVWLNEFKVGDIVKLKTGTKPIYITGVNGKEISYRYLYSTYTVKSTRHYTRNYEDFEYHDHHFKLNKETTENKYTTTKEENTMETLYNYKVDETSDAILCRKIGRDSQGVVVRLESDGTLKTVEPDKITEVRPYTIGVRFLGNSTTYSYLTYEGKYKVGELYIINDSLAFVKEVNTDSSKATKEFTPTLRVPTEAIT